jgi:cytoskeletal protein CcmA (bactofilin family)
MKKLLMLLIVSCLTFLGTAGLHPVSAADIRSGEDITIPATATNLKDMYLFGSMIKLDAPVTNDVVAAGGHIVISKPVSGSIIIAGGDLTVSGPTGNTIRAAGGKLYIDAPVTHDMVVAGGDIKTTQNAVVSGDAIINGGKINVEGPVKGKLIINGGEVTINAPISGNVTAEAGKLKLGPHAAINGTLSYKSQEKAALADGAVVKGKTDYTQIKERDNHDAKAILAAGTVYKLITDIILSVLFIYFFTRALTALLRRMTAKPVESGAIGLAFLIFFPVLAFILLLLVWLGLAAFLAYAFVILISVFLVKIFLGWFILRWWERRSKKTYVLDWKAGIIGPIVLYGMLLIPVIGWLASALLMFVATGAVVQEVSGLMAGQNLLPQKTAASNAAKPARKK